MRKSSASLDLSLTISISAMKVAMSSRQGYRTLPPLRPDYGKLHGQGLGEHCQVVVLPLGKRAGGKEGQPSRSLPLLLSLGWLRQEMDIIKPVLKLKLEQVNSQEQ